MTQFIILTIQSTRENFEAYNKLCPYLF